MPSHDPKNKNKNKNKNKRYKHTHTFIKKGKSASSANETRRDLELFKDIRKLSSSDEPFVIFGDHLFKIINIARSRRMPNQKQSIPWNKYALSFYCKLCTCFGVEYFHQEPLLSGKSVSS